LRLKKIGYWTATVLLALALLLGGAAHFVGQKDAVESVVRLGYPAYFVAILGFWKVLGGIALLLVPGFPRLKKWTSRRMWCAAVRPGTWPCLLS
jgi:uncharacterized membrane protein